MNVTKATSNQRKKRVLNFTDKEKRALIREVKKWSRIWDPSEKLHYNKNAVNEAWVQLSRSLRKEVNECKDAWISLRESYRYHARACKQKKRGSSRGDELDEILSSEEIDWEFAKEMAFLPNVSKKRSRGNVTHARQQVSQLQILHEPVSATSSVQTFVCNHQEQCQCPSPLGNEDELNSTQFSENDSQYDYDTKRAKPPTSSSSADERWGRFNKILKKQEEFLEGHKKSPYKQALSTFDWLLNKLPRSVGDDMCLHINKILLRKVEKYKSIQTRDKRCTKDYTLNSPSDSSSDDI